MPATWPAALAANVSRMKVLEMDVTMSQAGALNARSHIAAADRPKVWPRNYRNDKRKR